MKRIIQNFIRSNKFITLLLFQLTFCLPLHAQTLMVQGKITTSRFPIRDARVTFIDEADTTRKFSSLTDASGNYQIGIITSVTSGKSLPVNFTLAQNYPNPFSVSTSIPYQLNTQSDIQVSIYDILGRIVRKFTVGTQSAGTHSILWDGKNNSGERITTGIYFYKLQAGRESQVRKMIFNSGGHSGNVKLPSSSHSTNLLKADKDLNKNIQTGNYTIRVENTETTSPVIVSKKIENVFLQNDTTINFSVIYIPVATVSLDSLNQYIRGFGAANIVGWRPDMTDSEIETAFGTGDGQLGFSILRLRIPSDSNQWSVNLSTAKKVHNKGILLFASPWSPPASMKTNNNLIGGELRESSYADYAAYLNSFADYMANNGAPMYAVSLQNEPDITVTYESCDWSAEQMVKFLKEQGPLINTKIIAPESFQFRHNMSDPILNDSVACANLDILGGHIYGGGLSAYQLAEEKGKEIWMTEHLTESAHSANLWSLALAVGQEINQVMQANMSAYVWWYIVRYYGPIGDGEKSTTYPNETFSKKGEVTKKGYVMSQFARFVRPGYYRVESSVVPSLSKVNVTAYKDPSSSKIVIVAINNNPNPAEHVFRLQNGTTITLNTYTTSESKNCEKGETVNVENGSFSFTLEPSSITTFVSN